MSSKESRLASLAEVDLTDIQVINVKAGPTADGQAAELKEYEGGRREARIDFTIHEVRPRGRAFGIEISAEIVTVTVSASATIGAAFTSPDKDSRLDPSKEEVEQFIKDTAFPVIFPYFRSTFNALSSLLGEKPFNLPILRPGDVQAGIHPINSEPDKAKPVTSATSAD